MAIHELYAYVHLRNAADAIAFYTLCFWRDRKIQAHRAQRPTGTNALQCRYPAIMTLLKP